MPQSRLLMNQDSDSEDASTSKRKLTRGTRGRFVSSSPLNRRKAKRADQKRKDKEKRNETKNEIFNEFLACFVLQGKSHDSIVASRSKGPFSQLLEAIVKEECRLGPNLRHAGLKLFYSEGTYLRSATNGKGPRLSVKPNQYKGCRLPLVALGFEMKVVQNWIAMVREKNALVFPCENDALQYCKDVLRVSLANKNNPSAPLLPLSQNMLQHNNRGDSPFSDSSGTQIVKDLSPSVKKLTKQPQMQYRRPQEQTQAHAFEKTAQPVLNWRLARRIQLRSRKVLKKTYDNAKD